MSIRTINDKVISSKIGQVKCMNCNQKWGQHLGNSCPHGNGLFEPYGFSLYDRCKNCGDILKNHDMHAICSGGTMGFERANNMFSEEDFLL